MNVEEIEVTIDKHGQVQIHVRGVKGKKCLALTKIWNRPSAPR